MNKSNSSWSSWNLKAKKKKLTSTLQETLYLFFDKKSIHQIAKKRNLEEESIERQIIDLITLSYIDIDNVLKKETKNELLKITEKTKKLSEIKELANGEITYFQIKCILAHLNSFPIKFDEKKIKKKLFNREKNE